VKKAIAFLFVTVYLLSTTEMGQLLKVPAFVTHFVEHRQADSDITLWKFICIHYANDDVKYPDYEKDMKLPFKTHDHCGSQVNATIPPEPITFPPRRVIYLPSRMKYFNREHGLIASFHSLIWQPPRFC
jgi:hypothetical protein